MSQQISIEKCRREMLEFLGETFENVRGIYLDKGTSLFETLEPVTAEVASRAASGRSASVAAHVKHVAFYLRVVQASIRKEPIGKVNWREIWENTRAVTPEEWDAIRKELRREHANVLGLLGAPETWGGEDALEDSMAIIAHTAYHLGAIRQALAVTRH